MVGVEQWAVVRRMRGVDGLSIREISRRTGLHRDTVGRWLGAPEPPRYSRKPTGSKFLSVEWVWGPKPAPMACPLALM